MLAEQYLEKVKRLMREYLQSLPEGEAISLLSIIVENLYL